MATSDSPLHTVWLRNTTVSGMVSNLAPLPKELQGKNFKQNNFSRLLDFLMQKESLPVGDLRIGVHTEGYTKLKPD